MQRGTPSGTATSAAPSRGTSLQPRRRAARAGYSAVRSGDDVQIALSTSSGWNPVASWSARHSSAVPSGTAGPGAAGAAGAHLGQEALPLDRLRPHVPPGFLLGLSVGSPAEAERGRAWPADYWSVGPCFHTANKPDAGVPLGAEGFGRLARLAPAGTPVIGIGGVTAANAPALARAGAAGVAVIGAVWEASDPAAAARALRASIA